MAVELEPLGVRTTVVEPGCFRTEFLSGNSLVGTALRMDDYAGTTGAMRAFAAGADGQQPGDPQRLAGAVLEIVDVGDKHREVEAKLVSWRSLALSTDFVAA